MPSRDGSLDPDSRHPDGASLTRRLAGTLANRQRSQNPRRRRQGSFLLITQVKFCTIWSDYDESCFTTKHLSWKFSATRPQLQKKLQHRSIFRKFLQHRSCNPFFSNMGLDANFFCNRVQGNGDRSRPWRLHGSRGAPG